MTHRYRLYPTPAQEAALLEQCAQARYVYNLGLEQRLMWASWKGPTPGFFEQSRQLTEARRASEWLQAGIRISQEQALRDLDIAWMAFAKKKRGRPTWRKKGKHEGFSVRGAQHVQTVSHRWSTVAIPRLGPVRFRRTRPVPATNEIRIKRELDGRWFVSFRTPTDPVSGPGTGEVVGVDRGVKAAVTLSTGEASSPAGTTARRAERDIRLQRRLARARRGSRRHAALRVQLARLRAREADRRKDWVEKTTTDLARRFDVIRIEDLDVKRMTFSVGPRKARLNRGILDAAWGVFAARLEHKAPGRVGVIPPQYTSQRCNACGHVDRKNRKSQAVFRCVACKHEANADVNAARNIADGNPAVRQTVAARGDGEQLAQSVKREPQPKRRAVA